MKLRAIRIPYSSVVGGGLQLIDDKTRTARFVVNIMGTTAGITREENDAISHALATAILSLPDCAITVPDRPAPVALTTTPIQPKAGKHSSCRNEVQEYARQHPNESVPVPRSCKSCGLGPCKKGDRA